MKKIFIVVLLTSISQIMLAKMEKPLYKNPNASVAQRVDDLLRRMTLEEKVGQISSWYNHKRSAYFHPAVCADNTPLYPFGYGLSYTKFKYSNLVLSDTVIENDGKSAIKAQITIENIGNREGTEVCQLYINDIVSSVARPVKELKDFRRVTLKAGEKQTIEFIITPDKLAFYDVDMKLKIEPGEFKVMIGGSCKDEDLQQVTFNVK